MTTVVNGEIFIRSCSVVTSYSVNISSLSASSPENTVGLSYKEQ